MSRLPARLSVAGAATQITKQYQHGGGGRTRTCEAMRRLIYSQLPLPLGTLPRSYRGQGFWVETTGVEHKRPARGATHAVCGGRFMGTGRAEVNGHGRIGENQTGLTLYRDNTRILGTGRTVLSRAFLSIVMAGLDPAIHVFQHTTQERGCPGQARA